MEVLLSLAGSVLVAASAATFSGLLGVGPGLCAALGAWMLALVALPMLALRAGGASADADTENA